MPRRFVQLDKTSEREVSRILTFLRKGLDELRKRAGSPIGEYDKMVAQRRADALERATDALLVEYEKQSLIVTDNVARRAVLSSADGVPVAIDVSAVAHAKSVAASEVRNVSDAVRGQLRRAVLRAVSGVSQADEFVSELREAFDDPQPEERIEAIYRTELGGVWMSQRAKQDEQLLATTGVDVIKRWRTLGDGRVREDHRMIDGQERELDQDFHVGGGATKDTSWEEGEALPGAERARAPLDERLSPRLRINCRCNYSRVPRSRAQRSYTARVRATGAAPNLETTAVEPPSIESVIGDAPATPPPVLPSDVSAPIRRAMRNRALPANPPTPAPGRARGERTVDGTVVVPAYHGTDSAPFQFVREDFFGSETDDGLLGRGFYVSTDPAVARGNRTILAANVAMRRPLRVSYTSWEANKSRLVADALGLVGEILTGANLTTALLNLGFDGVILDYSPVGYAHQEIMVPRPAQVGVYAHEDRLDARE